MCWRTRDTKATCHIRVTAIRLTANLEIHYDLFSILDVRKPEMKIRFFG